MKLTQERLKEVLDYNPETGEFYWKAQVSSRAKAGCKAGWVNSIGYRQIWVSGKPYFAHRLAWLYVYGYFPENDIDHINRIRSDNRALNLREVSRSCNLRNAGGHTGSASGVKGVSKVGANWIAMIYVNGCNINLGVFTTLLGAAKARAEAEKEHGFTTCDSLSEAQVFVSNSPPEEFDSRVRKNKPLHRSGVVGVNWNKERCKWVARLKTTYLGSYNTIQEAAEVRQKAELMEG